MNRAGLIQQIAIRMDELTPSGEYAVPVDGVGANDNNPLYYTIDNLIDDGVVELFSVAPYWRLKQSSFDNVVVQDLPDSYRDRDANGPRKLVRLMVPDDFLRVAEISCPDFQRPITEVVPEQSDEGKRQHNRFLMGKEAKPVGVMSYGQWTVDQQTVPCREVDCYSLSDSSTVSPSDVSGTYIAKPGSIDSSAGNTDAVEDVVPLALIPALCWIVAARTFGARGDANHAAICQQNAQNLMV